MTGLAVLGLVLGAVAEPRIYALQADASVWDVTAFDVDGDGKTDVVAVCCDEKSDPLNKFIAVYLAGEGHDYPERPSFTVPLDPALSVLFPAEVDGKAPRELIAAGAEGIVVFGFDDGSLVPMQEQSFLSLFPSGSREPNFLKKAAQDLDGDGVDEWFVPIPSGFAVRNPEGLIASVRCDVDSGMRTGSGIYISNKFPAYFAFQQEGRNDKAIAFLSDEYADFAYGDKWTERDRFKIPLNVDDKWDTSSDMEDINGDGVPDLVITQTKGTINLKAVTQVYIAEGPMKYPDKPSVAFESNGSFAAPILKDVNGDKKLDIIFVNFPIGVRFFVNFFVWKKLTIDLHIHLYKDAGFTTKPDFTTAVSIEAPDGKEQAAYCMGDFNGDGKTDAAFGAGRDKLLLHAGGDAKFISSKPYLTLNVPAFGIARPYKLDGNDAEDIIIFHPGIDRKEFIEVLLF